MRFRLKRIVLVGDRGMITQAPKVRGSVRSGPVMNCSGWVRPPEV